MENQISFIRKIFHGEVIIAFVVIFTKSGVTVSRTQELWKFVKEFACMK